MGTNVPRSGAHLHTLLWPRPDQKYRPLGSSPHERKDPNDTTRSRIDGFVRRRIVLHASGRLWAFDCAMGRTLFAVLGLYED